MFSAQSQSGSETAEFAARLAPILRGEDMVLLSGDLGAGKTTFVKGLAAAFGVDAELVTSPTFALVHTYEGAPLAIHHLDIYRLSSLAEYEHLAVPELLDRRSIAVVEWGDRLKGALPDGYLHVAISFGEGDDERGLVVDPVGRQWSARAHLIAAAFESVPVRARSETDPLIEDSNDEGHHRGGAR